jgi:uncharacterized protein YbjT (DUF2867 family)
VSKRVLVFGAGGAVGEAAAHALAARGWRVTGSMRTAHDDVATRLKQSGVEVRFDDLDAEGDWAAAASQCDALVFATHLTLCIRALQRLGLGARRVVAFSSNNVAVQPKAAAYAELGEAEQTLRVLYPGAAILRPTLIYGDPRLPTITRLMRMARKWPMLPLPGAGNALVQPVFHEDLGRAAAWLADAEGGGTYALGGPDAVTMRALYRYVTRAVDSRAGIVSIPISLLRVAGPVLAALKLYSADQALRADRDRLAAQQTPLPAEIVPKVGLKEGLARLAAALS